MTIRGTLVLAGLTALAGYGCAHKYDENRRSSDAQPASDIPRDITPSMTPQELQGETQQGTGGAGPSSPTPTSVPSPASPGDTDINVPSESSSSSDTSGQFQITEPGSSMTLPDQSGRAMPATPTVPESKMNPGIGGSGTYDPAQDAKNCDRSQIGSPNSAGVDCDPLQGSDSTLPGTSAIGGSGLTDDTSKSFDDKKFEEKKLDEKKKDKVGTGGSGLTEDEKAKKKAKKHKKHLDESTKTTEGSTQSTEGTGGSGPSIPTDDKVQDQSPKQDYKDYQEFDKQVP